VIGRTHCQALGALYGSTGEGYAGLFEVVGDDVVTAVTFAVVSSRM
jgi:hypothetical protein